MSIISTWSIDVEVDVSDFLYWNLFILPLALPHPTPQKPKPSSSVSWLSYEPAHSVSSNIWFHMLFQQEKRLVLICTHMHSTSDTAVLHIRKRTYVFCLCANVTIALWREYCDLWIYLLFTCVEFDNYTY